ncbi:MAG: hypothetical protein ABF326_00635 [Arenicellales bacterium]
MKLLTIMTIYLSAAINHNSHLVNMKNPGILSICLISLYVSACDTHGLNTPVDKTTEMKIVPEIAPHEKIAETKAGALKNRHAMKLSIDDLPVDYQVNNENFLSAGSEPTEGNNSLFVTPNKKNADPGVKLSGKVFTNEDKLENKDYLNSFDGVQINIKGSFN